MHLVVADNQMQQHTFQRIVMDFLPESEKFDLMIERMRDGKDIGAASDGSRMDNGRASAGWLLWTMCDEIVDDRQLTRQRFFLMGSTICVDRRLDANTAFRVEALGCLIIPVIICLAKESKCGIGVITRDWWTDYAGCINRSDITQYRTQQTMILQYQQLTGRRRTTVD